MVKNILITLSLIFIVHISMSQVYIFESYGRSESIKKITKDTVIFNKEKTITTATVWGDWEADDTKIMLDLDKKEITLLGDSAITYNIIVRDDMVEDIHIIAMLVNRENKNYYIRIIKQEGASYHIYIDDKEKSVAYMAVIIKILNLDKE
jgi:hypothetical protein